MGNLTRTDFGLGWQPSADAVHCPKNALLRMDNCTLDEQGAVALRQGSEKINSAAFASLDVHSLFTAQLSGTRYRMAGATSAVFANGTSITTLNGSDDMAFGAHMGQILMARSTSTKKYDGTTVRTWGIAAVSAAPVLTAIAADSKVFATCAGAESPAMLPDETGLLITGATNATPIVITTSVAHGLSTGARVGIGSVGGNTAANGAWAITVTAATTFSLDTSVGNGSYTSGGIYLVFAADKAGTAAASVEIIPDATTGRGTATKTFAAPTTFLIYDAGQIGTDDDLIEFYAYITEPQYVSKITLMIDVNDGTFQEDWYGKEFLTGDAVADDVLTGDYVSEGFERDDVRVRLEEDLPVENRTVQIRTVEIRPDKPVGNVGWNRFVVARGAMERHGLTTAKNWTSVKAVRVTFTGAVGGSAGAMRFDDIRISGGAARPLTGKFKAAVVAVRNDGTYQALSPPSAYSDEIEVKAQGIRATIASGTIAVLDSQVSELWLFLMGGGLNAFYRFTVKTGGPFSGAQTIDATSSERTAAIANIRMETDNAIPPSDIIGIEGPHYDRTLVLTAQYIYPSRQRNPDSFSSAEVVRIGDAAETGLWIKKLNEQLYVGTTRDIYRIDGDWTVYPDGSLNVVKRPLGVSSPPISSAVSVGTINGSDALVYLSGDGWRVSGGGMLTSTGIDLLWRGYTRHGVFPVNLASGRFRLAISKNVLFAITPEGSSTTSSQTLHVFHFAKQRWYRQTYTPSFRSIYAEKDGTLIAGDTAGFVRILDLATKTDDGALIPVVIWTGIDDDGKPFTNKDAENFRMVADTGDVSATVAFHVNGDAGVNASTVEALNATDVGSADVTGIEAFRQMQFRITGSFSTFILRALDLTYLDAPDSRMVWDTNFPDVGLNNIAWVRRVRVKARTTADLLVRVYFNGVLAETKTVAVSGQVNTPFPFDIPLGREAKGFQPRVVVSSTLPFQVWWIELQHNESGVTKEKRIQRFLQP